MIDDRSGDHNGPVLFKVHGPLMFSKVFRGAEGAVCIYSLLLRYPGHDTGVRCRRVPYRNYRECVFHPCSPPQRAGMAPAWRRGLSLEAVAGRSPLHLAVMRPDDSLTLPSSTDVDSEDDAGCTALHYAAEAGNTWAVGLLLARGASANAADEHGSTPLAQAVLHVGAAEQLLAAAADPLAEDGYGRAPLGYAAQVVSAPVSVAIASAWPR